MDIVALLAEMLEVLLLALDVRKDEARPLGLEVNWQQSTTDQATAPSSLHISGNQVDVVVSYSSTLAMKFTALVAQHQKCVLGLAWPKAVFSLLNRGIWRSTLCLKKGPNFETV